MDASEDLLEFNKAFEGLRLRKYRAGAEKWTIGRGHLILPGEDLDEITLEKADELYAADMAVAVVAAAEAVDGADLRQHEFDAVVDFTYQFGAKKLQASTLLKLLKEGRFAEAALEFPRWCFVDGHRDAGVMWRRYGNLRIFLLADYTVRP